MLLKMVPVKRRFLIQYMLCALVPIIAMLILYSQAKSVVINNAYDSSGQMLRRNVQIVESGMQEIRRTCDYLLMNQTIVSFLRTDNPIVDGKKVSSVTAGQRTLATMMSSNNLIDSISVYALRSDMLIDSETSYIRMSGYYLCPHVQLAALRPPWGRFVSIMPPGPAQNACVGRLCCLKREAEHQEQPSACGHYRTVLALCRPDRPA